VRKKIGRPSKPEMQFYAVKLHEETIDYIRKLAEVTGVAQGTLIKSAIERTYKDQSN